MSAKYTNLVKQFFKFAAVGLIAFGLDYASFIILTYVAHLNYLVATPIAYTIGTIFNFIASMRYVYAGKEGQGRLEQFAIFIVLSIIGLVLNQVLMWLFVDALHIEAWIARLAAAFVVSMFNFITRKIFYEDKGARI